MGQIRFILRRKHFYEDWSRVRELMQGLPAATFDPTEELDENGDDVVLIGDLELDEASLRAKLEELQLTWSD
jgi:uncharacterized Zn ribbon protein